MGRLVTAVVILLGVLLGLRIVSSSTFQRNVANQTNTAPATRSTGFSTEARNQNAPGTTAVPQNTQQTPQNQQNQQNQSQQNPQTAQNSSTTTPLPPQTRPAIPAGW